MDFSREGNIKKKINVDNRGGKVDGRFYTALATHVECGSLLTILFLTVVTLRVLDLMNTKAISA